MITLSDAKDHLRVDGNLEDAYIERLLDVSSAYVSGIIGSNTDYTTSDDPVYDHCVLLLTSHWFENREAVTDGSPKTVPLSFKMLMQSIRPGDTLT